MVATDCQNKQVVFGIFENTQLKKCSLLDYKHHQITQRPQSPAGQENYWRIGYPQYQWTKPWQKKFEKPTWRTPPLTAGWKYLRRWPPLRRWQVSVSSCLSFLRRCKATMVTGRKCTKTLENFVFLLMLTDFANEVVQTCLFDLSGQFDSGHKSPNKSTRARGEKWLFFVSNRIQRSLK